MRQPSSLAFEWYIQDRVYITHVRGRVTRDTFDEMADNVLGVLNREERARPIHLIFNASQVHIDPGVSVHYMQQWSEQVYRHPRTASVLSVTGMNRLYTHIANMIGYVLFRGSQRGQAVQTLNEALLLVRAIDPSLPPFNV